MSVVFDSSAILAMLWDEPGGEVVTEQWDKGRICSVNFEEILTKLSDRGANPDQRAIVARQLAPLVAPFGAEEAVRSAELRSATKGRGLSLGDRACLALAETLNVPAVTADRAWGKLELDVEVQLIR